MNYKFEYKLLDKIHKNAKIYCRTKTFAVHCICRTLSKFM